MCNQCDEIIGLLSKGEVFDAFIESGFTVKDGHDDLKPHVYEAAKQLQVVLVAKIVDALEVHGDGADSPLGQRMNVFLSENCKAMLPHVTPGGQVERGLIEIAKAEE